MMRRLTLVTTFSVPIFNLLTYIETILAWLVTRERRKKSYGTPHSLQPTSDGQDPSSEYTGSANMQLGLKPLENKLPGTTRQMSKWA